MVRLVVIKQYRIDLSTRGFVKDNNMTFKHPELGSYSVTFSNINYPDSDEYYKYIPGSDGSYWVDYGTQIDVSATEGRYGKFQHFTGLTEEENNNGYFMVNEAKQVGVNFESTKLAAWIVPTILSTGVLVFLLFIMTLYLVMRSNKLKKLAAKREAEIKDMKRRFNIADEIAALRRGDNVPQTKS